MIDVTGNVKASMRLRAACEKAKKVLSANAEAVVNIECLIEEKDVRGVIRREDFEKLCARLLERVVEPCKRAVADSGIGLERLHSVELVGSGSRVPAIDKVLKEFFRRVNIFIFCRWRRKSKCAHTLNPVVCGDDTLIKMLDVHSYLSDYIVEISNESVVSPVSVLASLVAYMPSVWQFVSVICLKFESSGMANRAWCRGGSRGGAARRWSRLG